MIHDHNPRREELFSLLSTQIEMHHEIQIEGRHGTRTVKILEVLKQMQPPQKANLAFEKSKPLHALSKAERPLYVGRAIRHIIRQHEEHLGKIDSVRLQKIPSKKAGASGPSETIDLTDQALALANMSDADFKDFLKDLAHELAASEVHSAKEPQSKSMRDVVQEHGQKLAKAFKASKLGLSVDSKNPTKMLNHLAVRLAVRMAALAIYQNVLAERREEAKREEKEHIEKQELRRDILQREVLGDTLSRVEMNRIIIETLIEELKEEKGAREEDIEPIAGILVELVWSALPQAFKSGNGDREHSV